MKTSRHEQLEQLHLKERVVIGLGGLVAAAGVVGLGFGVSDHSQAHTAQEIAAASCTHRHVDCQQVTALYAELSRDDWFGVGGIAMAVGGAAMLLNGRAGLEKQWAVDRACEQIVINYEQLLYDNQE